MTQLFFVHSLVCMCMPSAEEYGRGAVLMPACCCPEQATAEAARGPKKLSDVKVNPSIAASLGSLPAPPPAAATAASNGSLGAQPAAAAPSAADLLLELDGPGMV